MAGSTMPSQHGVIIHQDAISVQDSETFDDLTRGNVSWKTLISAPLTATDSLTVGIASCPPQGGHLSLHQHSQAEVYHIISGRGAVSIDGKEHEVGQGSVIYIPGNVEHGVRNLHPESDLRWFYAFGANSFEDIVYKFTGALFDSTAAQGNPSDRISATV